MKKVISSMLLVPMMLLVSEVRGQSCSEQLSNGDFATVTSTAGNTHFCDGYVPSWFSSHGTPSIGGSPNYYAAMWTLFNGWQAIGEGITTNVSLTAGKRYLLSYKYRKNSASADVDQLFFQLVPSSYSFPNTCATSGVAIPNPPGTQLLGWRNSISNTTWATGYLCFTASSGMDKLWIYPESYTGNPNSQEVQIDDISIREIFADAGPDQSTCTSVLGPTCQIPGVTYSWSPSTGLNNPNISNPTATPSSATTYTLTVSVPGITCFYTDQVDVNPPACCLTAQYNWHPISPCEIQFNNMSSALTSPIIGYHWDFGDGSTSDEISPSHYFDGTGPYNVCLTITTFKDGQCCIDEYCTMVTTSCPPSPPCNIMPTFTYDLVCNNPCKYLFSGGTMAGSSKPIVAWHWDFGDGTTGSGQNIEHTFATSGVFHVCLTAIGKDGSSCCTGMYCFDVNVSGCNLSDEPGGGNISSDGTSRELDGSQYLKVYPNPSSEGTTIEYHLSEKSQVSITVYDMQGRVVRNVKSKESQESGNYSLELKGSELPAGTYICRMEIDGQSFSEKVVIIK